MKLEIDLKLSKELRILDLRNNEFSNFPEGIEELINLEYLYLDGNNLNSFLDTIYKFPKLKYLGFRGINMIG